MSRKSPKFNEHDAEYIRKYYQVPCMKNAPVEYTYKGVRRGQVVAVEGAYIYIQFENEPKPAGPFHPTWEMKWLSKEIQ